MSAEKFFLPFPSLRSVFHPHRRSAMRFMILVKASPESEAGAMPGEDLLAAMGAYHEELARAACCWTAWA
jgi:hypothetical protein